MMSQDDFQLFHNIVLAPEALSIFFHSHYSTMPVITIVSKAFLTHEECFIPKRAYGNKPSAALSRSFCFSAYLNCFVYCIENTLLSSLQVSSIQTNINIVPLICIFWSTEHYSINTLLSV